MVGMGVLGGVGECKGMKGSLDLCGCNSTRCVITLWGRKTSCVPHFAHSSCYCSELWRFTFLHLSCLSEWTAMVSQSGFGSLLRTESLLCHQRAWHSVFHFALTRRQPSILRAGASLAHAYADIHRPLPSMSYLQDTGNTHLNTGQDSSGWPLRTIHIHPKVLLQRLFQDPGKWQIPGEAFDRVACNRIVCGHMWHPENTKPKWVHCEILGGFHLQQYLL